MANVPRRGEPGELGGALNEAVYPDQRRGDAAPMEDTGETG